MLAQQVNARIELRMRRREAELALESAAQTGSLFTAFARSLPFPCWLKDKEHRLLFYNGPLAEAFRIGEREWLGKTSFELWPPELAQKIQAAEEAVFAVGTGSELAVEIAAAPERPAIRWLLHYRLCRVPASEPVLAVIAVNSGQA